MVTKETLGVRETRQRGIVNGMEGDGVEEGWGGMER